MAVTRRNFNPRSPRGLRLTGSEDNTASNDFNPRSPRGLRQVWAALDERLIEFQSTQPKRAATARALKGGANVEQISIHAAQEGCDNPRKESKKT